VLSDLLDNLGEFVRQTRHFDPDPFYKSRKPALSKMLLYEDTIANDEMFSDAFPLCVAASSAFSPSG
jgi:hypothetical protein